MSLQSISVRFWGVRGSIPCPGADTVTIGGNTSCVEIRCGEHLLIFDAGSGLRILGDAIAGTDAAKSVDLFFSHCHIDHIIGLPFFAPLFAKDHSIRLWAGGMRSSGGIKEAVRRLMSLPLFPIGIETAAADIMFNDFEVGDDLKPQAGIAVRTVALNHPGGATGYRVEFGGKVVAYVTDTELNDAAIDPALLMLIKDADILIMDSTYTAAELPSHRGWGHSSWQQVVEVADKANVGTLCLFHHDPDHDDQAMKEIASVAEKKRPGTIVAREGLTLTV
jgi:phosphoribosyl 1,2-cyclic phosphodiesterase